MDLKIFRTVDQGSEKLRNNAWALDAPRIFGTGFSFNNGRSHIFYSFISNLSPSLPRITPKSAVSSNFWIIFSKACLEIGPFSSNSNVDIHPMQLINYRRSDKITLSIKHDLKTFWRMIYDVDYCLFITIMQICIMFFLHEKRQL